MTFYGRCSLFLWLACVLVAGCAAKPLPDGTPAVIVNPDAASRAELRGILQTALGDAPLLLADDALTTSSTITIEPRAPRGLNAPPVNGRLLGRGEEFLLLLDGSQCLLKQQSSGLRWLLLDSECTPLPDTVQPSLQ